MAPESAGTVFENVRIFDGTAASLSGSSHVLVRGKTIETISSQKIPPADGETLRLIEGANRVLMPGLIDAHWHSMFAELSLVAALTADAGYINILSGKAAARTLQRGFTTVRDAGGPASVSRRPSTMGSSRGHASFLRVPSSRRHPGTATTARTTSCRGASAVTTRTARSWARR
jgi:imidazolonepropionase-like amidohydrolase